MGRPGSGLGATGRPRGRQGSAGPALHSAHALGPKARMGKVGRAHKRYQHKGLRRRAKSLCPFLLQSPHLPRGPAGVDDVSRYGFNGCGNNPSFPIPTRTTHGLGFQRATGYAVWIASLVLRGVDCPPRAGEAFPTPALPWEERVGVRLLNRPNNAPRLAPKHPR